MNRIYCLLSCLFCSFFLAAQQNAELLISFNKQALQLNERKPNNDFLQALEKHYLEAAGANADLLTAIYEQPETVGLSRENHVVGFVDVVNGFAHLGIQFPIADPALFEGSVRQYGQNALKNIKPIAATIDNPQIKAQLEESRAQQLERRQAIYRIRLVEGARAKYVIGAKWTLAWTPTHGFLLQTKALNAALAIDFTEREYSVQRTEIEAAKLDYLSRLFPITWRDHSHDVVAQLSPLVAQQLNAMTEESSASSPMGLIFDRPIQLAPTTQRVEFDFEANSLLVKLIEESRVTEEQIWSRADLARNWGNIQIEDTDDSLTVWLKVLEQLFNF
ncbi:MAG: hypothetical protein AAGI23_14485 [Bacteroidota bacterium]